MVTGSCPLGSLEPFLEFQYLHCNNGSLVSITALELGVADGQHSSRNSIGVLDKEIFFLFLNSKCKYLFHGSQKFQFFGFPGCYTLVTKVFLHWIVTTNTNSVNHEHKICKVPEIINQFNRTPLNVCKIIITLQHFFL